jgi:DNA-binding transcriptional regulator YiaG
VSGEEFRKLRRSINLKQSELGVLMDVSERGIRRWENGEIEIPRIAELALRYVVDAQKKGKKNR